MKDPVNRNDVNNSTARIWTKEQLRETKKQAKANGFEVSKIGFGGTVTVVDPESNDLVLKAVEGIKGTMFVRLDQNYFNV
jgi:hypothetical protein